MESALTVETLPEEFVARLPKTDLHVHLDGSIRIPTLIDLARECDVELPSYTEAGLKEQVFKDRYESLSEYLHGFSYTCAVLQTEEALERVAYELALDNQQEGVRYIEVRFAPQLHVRGRMNAVMVLAAVNRGLERARDEFNGRPEVQNKLEPPFHYGIIVSAMRKFNEHFSKYFRTIIRAHPYAPEKEVFKMASLECVRSAILARDQHGLPVVGFDLAGEEEGYPAEVHKEAFELAQKHFLKKTVHAGEAYGPESIFQAITDLYADRIGHGYYLLDPTAIRDPTISDPEAYVAKLCEYISDRRITLEICLSSNLQTNPNMQHISEHNFKLLRQARVSTTLCTDNRTVSNTTMTRELMLAVRELGVTRKDLKSIVIYGFKRSFFAGTYLEKRAFVRQVIDYYDKIEREYLGDVTSD
jgi:adenosine deaminase